MLNLFKTQRNKTADCPGDPTAASAFARISLLGDDSAGFVGRVIKQLTGGLCVMSPKLIPPGGLVRIDSGGRMLLGEVCHYAEVEREYALYVRVKHAVEESALASAAPQPDAEAAPPAAAILALLRAVRRHALHGDSTDYLKFTGGVEELETRAYSPGANLDSVAAAAAELVREYNRRTGEYYRRRIQQLERVVTALTQVANGPLPDSGSLTPDLDVLQRSLATEPAPAPVAEPAEVPLAHNEAASRGRS